MSAEVPIVKIESGEPETATQVPGDDVASTTEINKTTDQAAPTPAKLPDPRVGVTAVIQNAEGKFLCSIRKGSHGEGKCPLFFTHLILKEFCSVFQSTLEWDKKRISARFC